MAKTIRNPFSSEYRGTPDLGALSGRSDEFLTLITDPDESTEKLHVITDAAISKPGNEALKVLTRARRLVGVKRGLYRGFTVGSTDKNYAPIAAPNATRARQDAEPLIRAVDLLGLQFNRVYLHKRNANILATGPSKTFNELFEGSIQRIKDPLEDTPKDTAADFEAWRRYAIQAKAVHLRNREAHGSYICSCCGFDAPEQTVGILLCSSALAVSYTPHQGELGQIARDCGFYQAWVVGPEVKLELSR